LTIVQAQRLVWLIDEQRRCLKRANSLERRIIKLLAEHPKDSALTATTLAHLAAVLQAFSEDAKVGLTLARRELGEPNSIDDDDYDIGECPACRAD